MLRFQSGSVGWRSMRTCYRRFCFDFFPAFFRSLFDEFSKVNFEINLLTSDAFTIMSGSKCRWKASELRAKIVVEKANKHKLRRALAAARRMINCNLFIVMSRFEVVN